MIDSAIAADSYQYGYRGWYNVKYCYVTIQLTNTLITIKFINTETLVPTEVKGIIDILSGDFVQGSHGSNAEEESSN
jgi:hypothetical protein